MITLNITSTVIPRLADATEGSFNTLTVRKSQGLGSRRKPILSSEFTKLAQK